MVRMVINGVIFFLAIAFWLYTTHRLVQIFRPQLRRWIEAKKKAARKKTLTKAGVIDAAERFRKKR